MSGIFGFWQRQQGSYQKDIGRMQAWNRAYGKEDVGALVENHYGMGCCYEKLSVEAPKSAPVLYHFGKYAVIDAVIYNRDQLLQKSGAEEFLRVEMSDEEMLFWYIEKFGMDALRDVNGDFAGALYDDEKKELTLFRDHLGVRPLFYYAEKGSVAFSTDIRGLTALEWLDASVSEDWIFKTIAGYTTIGTENTEFAKIFCVNPASYITFRLGGEQHVTEKNTYWKLGTEKIRLGNREAYQEKLKELICDSIKRRLDVTSGLVGAELSGGLDSGVIDILIHRMGRECTFFSWSVDPKDLPMAENDERLVIQDICEQENITCHYGKQILELGEETKLAKNMRQIGCRVEQEEAQALRYALPPYINALAISEAAEYISESGAQVVFTGHGGDEGVSHRCNPYELFYHGEYYHYLRHMWSATHGQKGRIVKTLKKCRKNLREMGKKRKKPFRNPFGAPRLLNTSFEGRFEEKNMPVLHFAYDPQKYVIEGGSRNRLDTVAILGAYSGVRYLVPYLDYRVIDFAVSIPRYLYMKGRQNRYLFREAFKDIMPKSLYSLRIKEDNSRKNMESNPNWFQEYQRRKEEAVSKLDRSYWEQYLNYDLIEEWLRQGQPSDEERFADECILRCLFSCAMAENLVKKSREI